MAAKPQVTLTFAGDADKLTKAQEQVVKGNEEVADSTEKSSKAQESGEKSSAGYESRITKIGVATVAMSSALEDAGSLVSDLSDLQNRGRERAAAQARALADVEQAGLDAEQAIRDLAQANLDLDQAAIDVDQALEDQKQSLLDQKQAALDVKTAQKDLADAVKEHGKNSVEAQQAALDVSQAQRDLAQAGIDAHQAQNDLAQAQEDAKQANLDAAQAARDGKDAQLDLNEAQAEANPTQLQKVGRSIEDVTGVISGAIGTVSLLTLAYNALNISAARAAVVQGAVKIATLAGAVATGIATAATAAWGVVTAIATSPLTLIIAAVALIAVGIYLLATRTTFFQTIWKVAWTSIKNAAKFAIDLVIGYWTFLGGLIVKGVNLWWSMFTGFWSHVIDGGKAAYSWLAALPGRIGSVFSRIGDSIMGAFRRAFNFVSTAWNSTVGRLSWTVPGILGGGTISAPKLPHFHSGGKVPGTPGEEVLSVLQAGETVSPIGDSPGGGVVVQFSGGGSDLDRLLASWIATAVRTGKIKLRTSGGRVVAA